MCSSGTDRSSTLVDSSPLCPTVSNCTFLFILVFCQAVKTFTAHFVLYVVFLGTVSVSKEISSSSVFEGRKRAVAIQFGIDWKLLIVLLLSHALSPVGHTAFWHAWPITESHNNTLHSIYCFYFTIRYRLAIVNTHTDLPLIFYLLLKGQLTHLLWHLLGKSKRAATYM